ncbi:MAG TPA: RNA polymerase sigma factor [Pyrinomonadaceae bacterium]
MTKQTPEPFWVLRAQSGDREALNNLLEFVQEPLYRYILRLTGDASVAEDILQEVFIRIYRKLRWLKEPDLFRPWVFRIASREAFRKLKVERRWAEQVRDEAVLESIPAQTQEQARLELNELSGFITSLSPASRAVLILHYFHEMSLAEIADVLGIAQGTAKSRLAYGLESLRRAVKRESKQ